MSASFPLMFTARRLDSILVAPAEPTPNELKPLSSIDQQEGFRFYVPGINFYRNNPLMAGRDLAETVRSALSKALVFYYPLAGRLREGPGGKISVQCTGEGVLFVEADADIVLDDYLGSRPHPPFPCLEELLPAPAQSVGFLEAPLLCVQVTRLRCGGFVVGHRISHVMVDGTGWGQFMNAVGEMARGLPSPTVPPVWARELLSARQPDRLTLQHSVYAPPESGTTLRRGFFFSREEMSSLRRRLPPLLSSSSTRFDLLAAFIWRCRTIALGVPDDEETELVFAVNVRSRQSPPLPAGYYGNAAGHQVVGVNAGVLAGSPLGHAVELVRGAKASFTDAYTNSLLDFGMMSNGGQFYVHDYRHLGLHHMDFGWGVAAYGGPAVGDFPAFMSFLFPFINEEGEHGTLALLGLPAPAMERFVAEVEGATKPSEGDA